MIPRHSILSLAHSLSAAFSGSVIVVVDDEKTPGEQIETLKFEISDFEGRANYVDFSRPVQFTKPPRRLRAKPSMYVNRRTLCKRH